MRCFLMAARMALLEHCRNRLAMWLVLAYLPIWLTLTHTVIAQTPVPLLLRASGETVLANVNHVSQVSGAINAVTQIVGFMMFMVTFKSGAFDRRLAMAGYPRGHLVAAKVCALTFASALISGYATLITSLFWSPQQPVLLAVGVFTAALTYGALGVLLGTLVRGELEGMFLVIMTSIIDIGLQSPVLNPDASSDVLTALPTYGAMQTANTAGFSHAFPLSYIALELAWFVVLTAAGLLMFLRHTRDQSRVDRLPGNEPVLRTAEARSATRL
ncbi:ABC transporter permease [Lentzea sp. NEAU-D7]|uniref:ABC transporter permease n=1 Tax=Lentzea sp. NEAU-D7 TaxID=2994667 RepID=UPI00224B55A9|nr:ABC transporter permease [Lentzea sp. NEAU-D7]MCX2951577.1 ABC transporter permease [Lentzea sp. NEAU-D7]